MLNRKKVLLAFIFSYVLCTLVLPPVFAGKIPVSGYEKSLYPLPSFDAVTIFILVLLCVIFYIICGQYNLPKQKASVKVCLLKSSASFFAIAAVWAVFSAFAGGSFGAATAQKSASLPVFFAGVLCAAAFEEFLYRLYLPQSMLFFIQNAKLKNKNAGLLKTAPIAAEILCVLLFALAHRYLGFLAVLNAFFAGSVLRLLAKKTNIACSWLVHSIYNCTIFALAIFQ